MLIRFKLNLGSRDAAQVQLNPEDCTEGKSVEVDDDAAAWLTAKGFAYVVETIAAEPKETLKGVAEAPKGKK